MHEHHFVQNESHLLTRRRFLTVSFASPAAFTLAVLGGLVTLPPTPACADDDDVTPRNVEGPFYKPQSPRRASLLEQGMKGTKLLLTGRVRSTDRTLIARAMLDFWQADAHGVYDNDGYRMRGHQFTDGSGRYSLETIVPGPYFPRTPHIHVKVQAPNQPILTTQLFFPGEGRNGFDPLFKPALLMAVRETQHGKEATFDFVVARR